MSHRLSLDTLLRMSNHEMLRPASEQCVTSSDLVRHFGVWQDRAARAPVYVLHRGRPRLVLTSLDVMDALCAPHAGSATPDADAALAALIDASDQIVILIADDGTVARVNQAALARFGGAVRPGAAPAAIATAGGELLAAAIGRVLASGIAEAAEVIPERYPTRRFACAIDPFPGGCLLRTRDLTAEQQLADARAQAAAIVAAITAAEGVAVRIGLRGYMIDPPAALARLAGVAPEALATARLVTLVDVADRVAVGDALERVIEDGTPRSVRARLLIRGASSLAVTIGLAAVRHGSRVEEIVAGIVPNAA